MKPFVAISLGAILGANARYLVALWAAARWGVQFPYGTLIANFTGSFLIGVVMVAALTHFEHQALFRLFWVTGVLGGYTTFSSFSYETLALLEAQRYGTALSYVGTSILTGLAGVFLGTLLGRRFF